MRWYSFRALDDWTWLKIIMGCLFLWLLVGCDRVIPPITQGSTDTNPPVPVQIQPEVSHTPIATATMNSTCEWGKLVSPDYSCTH